MFDGPFLNTRYGIAGMTSPFTLTYDAALPVKYEPTPGYLGGYRMRVGPHEHVDIAGPYRDVATEAQVAHQLKAVAEAVLGFEPVREDRTRLHQLSAEQRRRYALSDATITRQLALRLGERIDCLTDFLIRY